MILHNFPPSMTHYSFTMRDFVRYPHKQQQPFHISMPPPTPQRDTSLLHPTSGGELPHAPWTHYTIWTEFSRYYARNRL